MKIVDIHTHHLPPAPGEAILNASPDTFDPQPGQFYSVGLHPWHLRADGMEDWQRLSDIATHPQVLAIGEAGLDKVAETNYDLQTTAFRRQIALAEAVGKPLIIHCVRSYNEVLQLKQELKPRVPWVIHGFRGKPQLARQLTAHGIRLSFGLRYQEEALRATPADMLFLETDDSLERIAPLYRQAARALSLPVEELTARIEDNIQRVFLSKPPVKLL